MEPIIGFGRVRDGGFALYCEIGIAISLRRIFDTRDYCDAKLIELRRNDPSGVIVKKNFPLRERLTINWIRTVEAGIYNRIFTYWHGSLTSCKAKEHYESIRFEYISSAHLFLFIFYILSVCILLVEILSRNR